MDSNTQETQQTMQSEQTQQTAHEQGPGATSMYVDARKTNRSWWKLTLLSLITFGIYTIVFYSSLGEDINLIATRRDGKKTMHFCLLYFLIGPLTFGIGTVVWLHRISTRIGDEARSRGIDTNFSASSFWLWNVLGSFIIVGPFIYLHKLCKTMNALCESYNATGI